MNENGRTKQPPEYCAKCGGNKCYHWADGCIAHGIGGVDASGKPTCPCTSADFVAAPAVAPSAEVEQAFERFAFDHGINFALRIDEKWRVDDVAVQFAAAHTAALRAENQRLKEIADLQQQMATLIGKDPAFVIAWNARSDGLIKERRELEQALKDSDSMLSLLRHRAGVPWGATGLPQEREVDAVIGKTRRILEAK